MVMSEKSVSLSVLVENTVSQEDLRAEHGFSVWLETPCGNVLWDTGQSSLFFENAQKMGVEIEKVSCIALSHGHYDHTGGLSTILGLNSQVRVCGHPDLFIQRFVRTRDRAFSEKSIGSPIVKEVVQTKCQSLELNRQPFEIIPGVFLTGEIPRTTHCENTGGDFFLDVECAFRDPIVDDQALYFETTRGIVVLLGCAHSGVINTIEYIGKLTGKDRLYGVMGGMHLLEASDERLEETAHALAKYDVQMIGPCHCTGERAKTLFRSLFPERMIDCATGKGLTFAL
jgi:7,8-dihydropterin-6-yl-methyl-4-(beta-D-ribofuranosyl)aminobenzene 5'-phosphate synthase